MEKKHSGLSALMKTVSNANILNSGGAPPEKRTRTRSIIMRCDGDCHSCEEHCDDCECPECDAQRAEDEWEARREAYE